MHTAREFWNILRVAIWYHELQSAITMLVSDIIEPTHLSFLQIVISNEELSLAVHDLLRTHGAFHHFVFFPKSTEY
jgi:hypothetical protein